MKTKPFEPHKSSIGETSANLVAVGAYVLLFISGYIPIIKFVPFLLPLVIFFVEKDSYLVKFSALQAALINVILGVLNIILIVISLASAAAAFATGSAAGLAGAGLVGLLSIIINLAAFVFMVIGVVNAYGFKAFYFPLVANLTEKLMGSFGKDVQ